MGCVRAPIPQLKSALVLPFDAEPLRGLDQLQVRVQMTNLVGRLDVSSREIFPLLLVSNSTEIEIATMASPVEVGCQGFSFLGDLGNALI